MHSFLRLNNGDNALSFNGGQVTVSNAYESLIVWRQLAKCCVRELGVIASHFSLAQLPVLLECWQSNQAND
jgi:hypothetical protein